MLTRSLNNKYQKLSLREIFKKKGKKIEMIFDKYVSTFNFYTSQRKISIIVTTIKVIKIFVNIFFLFNYYTRI